MVRETTPTNTGFSSLIKRDFFNRDGPKRQKMPLVQVASHENSAQAVQLMNRASTKFIKRQNTTMPSNQTRESVENKLSNALLPIEKDRKSQKSLSRNDTTSKTLSKNV